MNSEKEERGQTEGISDIADLIDNVFLKGKHDKNNNITFVRKNSDFRVQSSFNISK